MALDLAIIIIDRKDEAFKVRREIIFNLEVCTYVVKLPTKCVRGIGSF